MCSEGLQVAYGRPNVQKVVKLLIAIALLPSESALEGFEVRFYIHPRIYFWFVFIYCFYIMVSLSS